MTTVLCNPALAAAGSARLLLAACALPPLTSALLCRFHLLPSLKVPISIGMWTTFYEWNWTTVSDFLFGE